MNRNLNWIKQIHESTIPFTMNKPIDYYFWENYDNILTLLHWKERTLEGKLLERLRRIFIQKNVLLRFSTSENAKWKIYFFCVCPEYGLWFNWEGFKFCLLDSKAIIRQLISSVNIFRCWRFSFLLSIDSTAIPNVRRESAWWMNAWNNT